MGGVKVPLFKVKKDLSVYLISLRDMEVYEFDEKR